MIQETHSWNSGTENFVLSSASTFFQRTTPCLPPSQAIAQPQSNSTTIEALASLPQHPALQPDCSIWWDQLEHGLQQRFQALHLFMERLASGKSLPLALGLASNQFLNRKLRLIAPALRLKPGLRGRPGHSLTLPAWTWLGATDLLLLPDGSISVLDQDFSTPSGLEHLPRLSGTTIDTAAQQVREELFPHGLIHRGETPLLLEPRHPAADNPLNGFLARCLHAQRVHRSQLQADRNGLFTVQNGHRCRIRCLVRRIDDELLDPNFFRPDSLVGLPGLVRRWSAGETSVLHAPGSSLLRLKTIVRLLPAIIREFLQQEPFIRTAELLECCQPHDLNRILRNPRDFVFRRSDPGEPVRPLCGRLASTSELAHLLDHIQKHPDGWCARPIRPATEHARHMRVFATHTDKFRLLRKALLQSPLADGTTPHLIPAESPLELLLPAPVTPPSKHPSKPPLPPPNPPAIQWGQSP